MFQLTQAHAHTHTHKLTDILTHINPQHANLTSHTLTNLTVHFVCEGFLAIARAAAIVSLGNLPHMCIHRNGS